MLTVHAACELAMRRLALALPVAELLLCQQWALVATRLRANLRTVTFNARWRLTGFERPC